MKIRLGILEKDQLYKTRLINYFNANYADKLEIFSFSTLDSLLQYVAGKSLDVLLADEVSVPDAKVIPKNLAFAYWSEAANIDSIRDVRAVCKYQKAELIYKEILGLFAELDTSVTAYKLDGSSGAVITFVGTGGGVGATTAAVGCAMRIARMGKKVLFLDLTELGDTSLYFSGEGIFTLSDVLYSIKSKHANLFLKMESMVKKDASGVFFYDSCKVPLDIRDTKPEEIERLIKASTESKAYDYLILDVDSAMTSRQKTVFEQSSFIILVGNGTPSSNVKMERMVEAIRLEGDQEGRILRKLMILYNGFHTGAQKAKLQEDIPELGGINAYKNGTCHQIAEEIAGKTVFNCFLAEE